MWRGRRVIWDQQRAARTSAWVNSMITEARGCRRAQEVLDARTLGCGCRFSANFHAQESERSGTSTHTALAACLAAARPEREPALALALCRVIHAGGCGAQEHIGGSSLRPARKREGQSEAARTVPGSWTGRGCSSWPMPPKGPQRASDGVLAPGLPRRQHRPCLPRGALGQLY